MRLLSIDPATTTGWAVLDDGQRISSGVLNFSSKKTAAPGERFATAYNEFCLLVAEQKPDTIVYEAVKRWQSSQAALVYGGITAMLQTCSYRNNVPIYGVAPKSAKKVCTGNGNASKAQMITWANEHFNIQVQDDNEADALAIGYTYLHERANIQRTENNV